MEKYLHLFDTVQEFSTQYVDNYIEPWVSYTIANGKVHYNKGKFNGHDYVDLGLPSGTKWATCNIGAASPEEYGSFVSWGDRSSNKTSFNWSNYIWGTENSLTKYNSTDGKKTITAEDDIAFIEFGGSWKVPSVAQCQELIDNTTMTTGTMNGVSGAYLTSNINGEQLFIPFAGFVHTTYGTMKVGTQGSLWTSELDSNASNKYGSWLVCDSTGIAVNMDGIAFDRAAGVCVRPVLQDKNVMDTSFVRYFGKSKNIYNDNGTLKSDDYYTIIFNESTGLTLDMRMLVKENNGTFTSTLTAHDCITTGINYYTNNGWTFYYLNPNNGQWSECAVIINDRGDEYTWTSGNNSFRMEYVEVHPQDGRNKTLYGIKNLYKNDVLIEEYINLVWEPVQNLANFSHWSVGNAEWSDSQYFDRDYSICEAVKLTGKSIYTTPVSE